MKSLDKNQKNAILSTVTQSDTGRFLFVSADEFTNLYCWVKYPVLLDFRPADCVTTSAGNTGYFAMQSTKVCSKCKKEQPVAEFGKQKGRRDGLRPHCKSCRRQYREENKDTIRAKKKAYREANAEQISAKKKAYYEANKDEILEGRREYYATNAEQVRARAARYRNANREKVRAGCRSYYRKNKNKILKYLKRWRERNPDYGPEYDRRYREEHREEKRQYERAYYALKPHKERAKKHRRRSRVRNAEGSFTAEQFNQLCQQYGGVCLRCHKKKKLTPDHVIPLAKGGTNWIENIQPLCARCNSIKGTRTTDYRRVE